MLAEITLSLTLRLDGERFCHRRGTSTRHGTKSFKILIISGTVAPERGRARRAFAPPLFLGGANIIFCLKYPWPYECQLGIIHKVCGIL